MNKILLTLFVFMGIVVPVEAMNINNLFSSSTVQTACVFCNIPRAQIIKEGKHAVAIRKLRAVNGVNFLVVPKKHFKNLKECSAQEAAEFFAEAVTIIQELSRKSKQTGDFTLTINNGPASAQTVFHSHIHVTSPDSSWGF